MRKNAKNNKKGFTLIELIVVVAILVALMLMLVPRLTGFTDEATKTANTANARAIYTAINASETASSTKLYSNVSGASNYQEEITLCGVQVYKVFWDEKVPADGVCAYDPIQILSLMDSILKRVHRVFIQFLIVLQVENSSQIN